MIPKNRLVLQEDRSFWLSPVTVVFCSGLLFFASQLLGAVLVYSLQLQHSSKNFQLFMAVFFGLIALLGMISAFKYIFGLHWHHFGLKKPKWKYIAVLPAVFICYMFISAFIMFALHKFVPGFDVDQAQDIGFGDAQSLLERTSMFFSLVAITPLFEELIFRGALFLGLRRRLPFWAASVLASVLFALAHGQWNVAADTFVLSMILCYLTEKSGSIVPAILLHAIKNGLAFILLFVINS